MSAPISFALAYFLSCKTFWNSFQFKNMIIVLTHLWALCELFDPFSLCAQWKVQTYRPRDGQLAAGPSTPTNVRGRYHRNYNDTATAKLWGHMLRTHTNNANPHRLYNLSLAAVLTHPSSTNTISMSSLVPDATPKCQCWNLVTEGDREAKVLLFCFESQMFFQEQLL